MSVSSIFSAGGSENRSALPAQAELRSLLERCRPSTVLRSLPGDLPSSNLPPNILIFRTEALMELDRFQEAYNLL